MHGCAHTCCTTCVQRYVRECERVCVCGLCDLSRVCINCVLDQCRACSIQGRPVIINKLPVPAEMPPGPVSAPPRFPWGLSGHLPAGKALFCSITANAVVCHFPLHFLIIFSNGICYRIKTKRTWRKKHILFVWHPRGTELFFFAEPWINKFCSFLKAALLEKLAKAGVNCLYAEHVVWITSRLIFSGVTRSCTGVSFFSVLRSAKKDL